MSIESVFQGYALEITAKANAGVSRCRRLLNEDFVSNAPRNLVLTLLNVFDYIGKVAPVVASNIRWNGSEIEKESDQKVLRVLDHVLKEFASHIRYVESARTDRLPWQVIPSFERLVEHLRPGAQVMLRPMWHYNYATIVSNLKEYYLDNLQEYEYFLPTINVESDVLKPLGETFHIISFPALERDNILLHSLIGHEIGHLIAKELVKSDEKDFLGKVQSEIELATDQELNDKGITEKDLTPLVFSRYRAQKINEHNDLCLRFWSRALEEILSDVVGAVLFGPAALFSTLEIAIQIGFDIPPTQRNNFYPPWRTRIREVFKVVESLSGGLLKANPELFRMASPVAFQPISSELGLTSEKRAELVNELVATIRKIAEDASDDAVIQTSAFASIAYENLGEYIDKHTEVIKSTIGEKLFDEASLTGILPSLIERLDAGITPNAEHDMPSKEGLPVRLVDVLNSAWFHKASLSMDTSRLSDLAPFETVRSQRNRLTLKSIEFVFISNEHPAPTLTTAKSHSTTKNHLGVLTTDDIQAWMENPQVTERLIVTPLFDPSQSIGPAAVDVRLGAEFILFKKETFQSLDVTSDDSILGDVIRYRRRIVRRIRERFILHPGQLVIGSTMEYIQIPNGLMAYVIGKSTWGRTGLIIATATKVDPGFRGCITLEIVNEGEVPLVLVPGIPIAQLVLHRTEQDSQYNGVYACPIGPEFPRFERLVDSAKFWLPGKASS